MSVDFVVNIYKITQQFPSEEKFGLVSQMRRAAISIPSNIAEGAGRKGAKENIQFLYIALGSLTELDTQLIIANKLDFIQSADAESELASIKVKLINYIKYLKKLNF